MKSFNTSDARIAKAILAKADKLIPKRSDILTRIEQIEEEYRRKCEEKKAQLVVEEDRLGKAIEDLESAMNMVCDCTLEEARESLFGDGNNVVVDEDTDEDVDEVTVDTKDDDLEVVDEDEPVSEDEESAEEEDELPDAAEPEANDGWDGFGDTPEDYESDDDDDDIPEPEDEDEFSNVDMESFSPDGTLNSLFN